MTKSHYHLNAHKRHIPICPVCDRQAGETETKYGKRNQCCGLWSWHRYPLTDKETHDARKEAHKAFDSLWYKGGGHLKRGLCYKLLAKQMNMDRVECHIKRMDKDQARAVVGAVARIKKTSVWMESV